MRNDALHLLFALPCVPTLWSSAMKDQDLSTVSSSWSMMERQIIHVQVTLNFQCFSNELRIVHNFGWFCEFTFSFSSRSMKSFPHPMTWPSGIINYSSSLRPSTTPWLFMTMGVFLGHFSKSLATVFSWRWEEMCPNKIHSQQRHAYFAFTYSISTLKLLLTL